MDDQLPIDVVPGTVPPKFTWTQIVNDFMGGVREVSQVGGLPVSVERPVADLIALAKRLMRENTALRVAQVKRLETTQVAATKRGKGQ